MFIFLLLSPSARLQVQLFFLPFARPFRRCMVLKECLRVTCLCAIIIQCTITFHWKDVPLYVFCLFCLIVIAASALHILSTFIFVSFYLLQGSNSFPPLNRAFLLSYKRRRLDGRLRSVEMRIRVCRSGVSGMVYQKILHLSICYTVSQSSACRYTELSPFYQLWSRALPERASIAVE